MTKKCFLVLVMVYLITGFAQATTLDSQLELAKTYNDQAVQYYQQGRFQQALPLAEKALNIRTEVLGEKHADTLGSLNYLAEIYRELGRFYEALPLSEKSYLLSKNELGKTHPLTLASLNNLVVIYKDLGRLKEALPLAEKNYPLVKKVRGENRPETITALNNLVMIYQGLGRLDEALPLAKKCYSLSQEVLGEKHPNSLTSLNNLAVIYHELDRLEEALPLFKTCHRLSKEVLGDNHFITIACQNNVAEIYTSLAHPSDALPLLEESYTRFKKVFGEKHPYTLMTLFNLATAYQKQGNFNKTIQYLEKSLDIVENLRSGDLSAENRQTLFNKWVPSYFSLLGLYIAHSHFFDAFHRTDMSKPYILKAFRVAEMSKARTLLESITAKLAAQQSELTRAEKRKLRKYEVRLASLNNRIAKALEEDQLEETIRLETKKNSLVNQLAEFERELMAKYPKYARLSKVQIVGAKEGAKYLPADSVLISYLVSDDKWNKNNVLAFTLQANGMLTAHYLGELTDLEKTVKKYLRRLSLKKTRGRVILWPETKKDVVEPLKDIIKDKRRWIISPSGPLALIPFETLHINGEQVIAQHQVTYVQSLSVLKLLKEREQAYQRIEKRGTLLAMGAPIYETFGNSHTPTSEHSRADIKIASKLVDSSDDPERYTRALRQLNLKWRNLPGALKELKQLKNLFFFKTHRLRIYKYKQAEATEANLQRLNKFGILAKYSYLVFSTHGYLSTEVPALSSIVLGQVNNPPGIDGYVTAGEWPAYNLKSDLMVLSACETGVGEVVSGEGVMGLPYAFYVAGNKNTLLTLWSISDEVTAKFIASFFRKLKMEYGQIEALTATKREFIEEGYGEAYWAAFVLYGV